MITCNPGDALTAAWGRQAGRLQPGALGDVVVVASSGSGNAFKRVLDATEQDIELVVVAGRPLYGTAALMKKAKASDTAALRVAGKPRRLSMTHLDDGGAAWTFDEVLERIEQVRSHPREEIEKARNKAFAGALRGEPAGLRLALDMPTGKVPIGGLPKDLGRIVVPPIQPLAHDDDFFAAVEEGGFHGGLLNRLSAFYA